MSEKQYLGLLTHVLDHGERRQDRTGTGTVGVFGAQCRYDLQKGFPALTTKKLYWKGVVHELLWFLKGDTNIKYLVDNGVHIWDDDALRHYRTMHDNWAEPEYDGPPLTKDEFMQSLDQESYINGYIYGDLGPVYGAQWRRWKGPVDPDDPSGKQIEIDQLSDLIRGIKNNPFSRRHILSSWNVGEIWDMGLPPCHVTIQFYVSNDKHLSCHMYQRSADMFLGVPFNIASYALLTHMIAQVCGLQAGEFIHSLGDAHIYLNHVQQVEEQIKRTPYKLPKLELNQEIKNIDDFKYEDIRLVEYKSHPAIKAKLSVGV